MFWIRTLCHVTSTIINGTMLKISKLRESEACPEIFRYGTESSVMAIITYKNDIMVLDAWTEELLKVYSNLKELV